MTYPSRAVTLARKSIVGAPEGRGYPLTKGWTSYSMGSGQAMRR